MFLQFFTLYSFDNFKKELGHTNFAVMLAAPLTSQQTLVEHTSFEYCQCIPAQ